MPENFKRNIFNYVLVVIVLKKLFSRSQHSSGSIPWLQNRVLENGFNNNALKNYWGYG